MENVGSDMPRGSQAMCNLSGVLDLGSARSGLARPTVTPVPCGFEGPQWRSIWAVSGTLAELADMSQRMPPRFADPDRAREVAQAFDLRRLPAEYYANPYPTYHALREHDPVHRLPDGGYFLSRYADCVAVYKDTGAYSSDKKREFAPKYGDSLLYEHHTTSLVFNDPPLHTRVRRIIAGAFTPRAIADMEHPVVALVDGLLDAMAAKGTADLIADLAAAVPVEVIGNLLAVPREERGPLREWSLAILGALEPVLTEEQRERGERAVAGFLEYLRTLVAARRAHPGDPERDVLTRLIQGEADGARLSERELLHNIIFILNAGHETTTNLIGNGLYALLEWPEEKARLIARPELIRPARRGIPALRELQPARQPGDHARGRDRRRGDAGRHVHYHRHRRRQPRPRRVRRSRPARRRPRAQPPPGLRLGRACVRRPQRGAAGGPDRDRAIPGALPGLRGSPASRCAGGGRGFGGFCRSRLRCDASPETSPRRPATFAPAAWVPTDAQRRPDASGTGWSVRPTLARRPLCR